MKLIEGMLRFLLENIKNSLLRNKLFKKIIYDINNSSEFSDLYEHEKMLADKVRLSTYYKGINKYINEKDYVVDLGTGTGILSYFAAKNNPQIIYAIDHSDFIEVAKEISKNNNLTNIEFIRKNSRNFSPNEKIDVILHEQIGDDLFNENMIDNLLDLKKRTLKNGGIILPGKFEIFLEPVNLKDDYRVPFLWEKDVFGLDLSFLKNNEIIKKYINEMYLQKDIEAKAINYFICDPEPIYTFDINTINSEDDIKHIINCKKIAKKSGELHGFCFYFSVIFDEEINFNTSPLSLNTSWGNKIMRVEERYYTEGDNIDFELKMDDIKNIYSWSINLQIGHGTK
jgi:predicted RNA methylase